MTQNDEYRLRAQLGLDVATNSDSPEHSHDAHSAQRARDEHKALLRAYEVFDQNHDAERERLLGALPSHEPATVRIKDWRYSAHPITRQTAAKRAFAILTPAAAILLLAVYFFFGSSPKPALARALERLRQSNTIVCRITTTASDEKHETLSGTMTVSPQWGTRVDISPDTAAAMTMFVRRDGTMVSLLHASKTHMTIRTEDNPLLLSGSAQAPDAWLRGLISAKDAATRRLPNELVEGVDCERYEIPMGATGDSGLGHAASSIGDAAPRMTLWINPLLGAVMKFEVVTSGVEPGSTLRIVHDQFQWDAAHEPDFFKPHVPAGYVEARLSIPAASEESLIEGLRAYSAELHEFPPALELSTMVPRFSAVIARRQARMHADGVPRDAIDAENAPLLRLSSGCVFYQRLLKRGAEPKYFGDEVTPGEAERVLLLYRLESGAQRVIYGDLRADTLPIKSGE